MWLCLFARVPVRAFVCIRVSLYVCMAVCVCVSVCVYKYI